MDTKKRMSISLPDDLERRLVELRMTERFCRCSYAEIIREVMGVGISEIKKRVNLDDPPSPEQRAG